MLSPHIIRKSRLLLMAIIIFLFSGCGQKGALYLPDENQASLFSVHPHLT